GTIPTGETAVPASDQAHGEVAVEGTPLPELVPTADPSIGADAPLVRGTSLDGSELEAPVPGRPTVVMFLAHWCPHCQAEVPPIAEWLAADGMPEGVDLVAVATANDASAAN